MKHKTVTFGVYDWVENPKYRWWKPWQPITVRVKIGTTTMKLDAKDSNSVAELKGENQ